MAVATDSTERDQFQGFYLRVAPALRGYIGRVCGDQALADDIFQESFLKFLRTVRWSAPERQQKAFLFKIAARLIIDHGRRIKPDSLDAAELAGDGDAPAVRRQHMETDMEKLFNALKPRDRSLLWLAYVEGYSHEEMAEVLGLKAKSIRVLLFRLRGSFAAALRGKGYGQEEQP
jgi:RNA polymerase sigma-70 factor, ECF subfamily